MEADFTSNLIIIVTLVVLEAVLSFDNAAILAVMSRKLPEGGGRRRALNYGLLIAYALRILAIFLAVQLTQSPLFLSLGGLYLLFIFVKHMVGLIRHRGLEEHQIQEKSMATPLCGMSALTVVVIQIGIVDLAFAVDQVVAAVSFTPDIWLIVIASTLGLLSLRILAPVISRLMDWLPLLEHMAFVAVGFVGGILVLEHPLGWPEAPPSIVHVLALVKIPVTLSLFAVPILVKAIFKVPRAKRHGPGQTTTDLDRANDHLLPSKPKP